MTNREGSCANYCAADITQCRLLTALAPAILITIFLVQPCLSQPASGYYYRRSITIDHTQVPSGQNQFPVLVAGTYSFLAATPNGQVQNTHGYDVIFTSDIQGTTQLNHEIETYNPSTGQCSFWVMVPSISSTAPDTVIYMFYGNPNISQSQENKTAVWDSGYEGVYHLKENPAGLAPQLKDSAINANHLTTAGSMTPGEQVTGQIGGAVNFANSSQSASTPGNFSLSGTAITLSAWVNLPSTSGTHSVAGDAGTTDLSPNNYFNIENGLVVYHLNGLHGDLTGIRSFTANTWHYVVCTLDGTTESIYLDGTLYASVTKLTPALSNFPFTIANSVSSSRSHGYLLGVLDEVRASLSVRSPDWILTEYNNQSSPSTFYMVGAEAPLDVIISISPTASALYQGLNQQFTATVFNASNNGINWSISPAVGTIGNSGLYTPPLVIGTAQSVTVTAQSQADPTKTATATISLLPVAISVSPTAPPPLYASQTQQFTATLTNAVNQTVAWSLNPSVGSVSNSGLYTAPSSINTQQTITITATTQADASKSASATVTLYPPVSVSVAPTSAVLYASQTQQFTATVTNAVNQTVSWSLSPALGSVSNSGLYTAPSTITTQQTVTVIATSQADNTKSASAALTLYPPVSVTVAPATATLYASQAQQFTATVTNAFNQAVTWSLSPVIGSIDNTGKYTAPSSITTQQTVTVTANSQADSSKSASATITLYPLVSVSVSPTTAALYASQTQQFTAAVANATNQAVMWSLSPAVGSIDNNGLYTAPSSISSNQTVTVTAQSQADTTKTATAAVNLAPVAVSITPTSTTLVGGQSQQFVATVTNSTNTAVVWSRTPGVGAIDNSGLYIPPAMITANQAVTVTAQSQADPSKTITATINLVPVAISISPGSVTLNNGQQQQFTATITNTPNPGVNWSISPAMGTVTNSGTYIAPAIIPTAQTITLTAQSQADTSKTSVASIYLAEPPPPNQACTLNGSPTPCLTLADLPYTGFVNWLTGLGEANQQPRQGPWSTTNQAINVTLNSAGYLQRADNTGFAWDGSEWTLPDLCPGGQNITTFAGRFPAPDLPTLTPPFADYNGYGGSNAFGDDLVGVLGGSPLTLTFSTPVAGAGFLISSRNLQNFTATLQAYDAQNNLLGTYAVTATSLGGACNGLGDLSPWPGDPQGENPRPCANPADSAYYSPPPFIALLGQNNNISALVLQTNDNAGFFMDALYFAGPPGGQTETSTLQVPLSPPTPDPAPTPSLVGSSAPVPMCNTMAGTWTDAAAGATWTLFQGAGASKVTNTSSCGTLFTWDVSWYQNRNGSYTLNASNPQPPSDSCVVAMSASYIVTFQTDACSNSGALQAQLGWFFQGGQNNQNHTLTRQTAPSFQINSANIVANAINVTFAAPNITDTLTVRLNGDNILSLPPVTGVNGVGSRTIPFGRNSLPPGQYSTASVTWGGATATAPVSFNVLGNTRFTQYNVPYESLCPANQQDAWILTEVVNYVCKWNLVKLGAQFASQTQTNGTGVSTRYGVLKPWKTNQMCTKAQDAAPNGTNSFNAVDSGANPLTKVRGSCNGVLSDATGAANQMTNNNAPPGSVATWPAPVFGSPGQAYWACSDQLLIVFPGDQSDPLGVRLTQDTCDQTKCGNPQTYNGANAHIDLFNASQTCNPTDLGDYGTFTSIRLR